MKPEIKIKPFNNKFDLFIKIDGRVIHCQKFDTIAEIEAATPDLLARVKKAHDQAKVSELILNAALGNL